MPFWVTWFLIGAFVTTGAAISAQNNASNVAAYHPPTTQIGQGGKEGN